MRSNTSFLLLALIGVVVGHLDDFDPWLLGLSVAPDTAGPMAQKFVARMTRSVESRDSAVIAGLFQPGFVFKGCDRVLEKDQITAHLSGTPAAIKVSFKLGPIRDLRDGENIEFAVAGDGLDALFLLNRHDQQLVSGYAPKCPKNRFVGIVGRDSSLHEMNREFF